MIDRLRFFSACSLWLLPWLNPFTPGPSMLIWPWLVALAATAGLFAVQATSPRQQGFVVEHAIPWAWLLAGALSSAMALVQYLGWSANFWPWISFSQTGEAYANLRQRNQFATLTVMALAALCWWVVSLKQSKAEAGWLPIGVAVLLGVGNAASSSRTGLLQILLTLMLVGLWGTLRQHSLRRVLMAFVMAYALALLLLPWLIGLDPLNHGTWARLAKGDAPCQSRSTLWRNVIELIVQKPWGGWGWGELNYAHFMTLYDEPRFCDMLDNAHNLPLHLAVELGLPIALAIFGTIAWLVVRVKPWREADPRRQLAWTVLALIGFHSLLEYPLWYGPFQMAAVACVLLLMPGKQVLAENDKKNVVFTSTGYAVIAAFLITVFTYVGWDYHRISQIYLKPELRDLAYQSDTMAKMQGSLLFQNQVQFALLTTLHLTPENAAQANSLAHILLHYSPEARVVMKLIDSAALLGRDEEESFYRTRFKAADPEAYAIWSASRHPRTP